MKSSDLFLSVTRIIKLHLGMLSFCAKYAFYTKIPVADIIGYVPKRTCTRWLMDRKQLLWSRGTVSCLRCDQKCLLFYLISTSLCFTIWLLDVINNQRDLLPFPGGTKGCFPDNVAFPSQTRWEDGQAVLPISRNIGGTGAFEKHSSSIFTESLIRNQVQAFIFLQFDPS